MVLMEQLFFQDTVSKIDRHLDTLRNMVVMPSRVPVSQDIEDDDDSGLLVTRQAPAFRRAVNPVSGGKKCSSNRMAEAEANILPRRIPDSLQYAHNPS
jgi:hypothetical protein